MDAGTPLGHRTPVEALTFGKVLSVRAQVEDTRLVVNSVRWRHEGTFNASVVVGWMEMFATLGLRLVL